jgi:hypothetical protein
MCQVLVVPAAVLLSVQAFGWMLATLPLLCHLRGWGLFLLFAVASVATSVSCWKGTPQAVLRKCVTGTALSHPECIRIFYAVSTARCQAG